MNSHVMPFTLCVVAMALFAGQKDWSLAMLVGAAAVYFGVKAW